MRVCMRTAKLAKSVKLFKAVVKYKSKVCAHRKEGKVSMHTHTLWTGARVRQACVRSYRQRPSFVQVVPEKKNKKALKIFKKFIKGSDYVPKQVQNELASQVENFDFTAQNMFQPAEDILMELCQAKFNEFKQR